MAAREERYHLLNLSADSYHCFVFFALSCASKNTFFFLVCFHARKGERGFSYTQARIKPTIRVYARSLSLASRPSLNMSAASPV